MIVLDTHVWVWWLANVQPLSLKVQKLLREGQSQKSIYISAISVWEVAQLATCGRLQLTIDYVDWITQAESLPFINFIPVDKHIALKSIQLPAPLHQDPADRIIIATTVVLGAVLITKDEKILQYPHVKTMW